MNKLHSPLKVKAQQKQPKLPISVSKVLEAHVASFSIIYFYLYLFKSV